MQRRNYILALALFTLNAHAFINIEELRSQKDQGASGSLGAKVEGKSGNTEKMIAEMSSLNLFRNEAREYILMGKYKYGESFRTKDTHEGQLHVRYAKYFGSRLALELFAQTEFNEFRSLKRRDLLGVGARFPLFSENGNVLALGTGGFYEHELFNEAPWTEEAVRGNFYVSWVRKISTTAVASLIAYYQPSSKSVADYRLQVDAGLSVSVTQSVSLVLDLTLQKDSQPPTGIAPTDTTYLAGFTWTY